MVFSVWAIIRYEMPRRLRITVTRVAMMSAEPCSSLRPSAVRLIMVRSLPFMVDPLRPDRERQVRRNVDRADSAGVARVAEVVLDRDQLAGREAGVDDLG